MRRGEDGVFGAIDDFETVVGDQTTELELVGGRDDESFRREVDDSGAGAVLVVAFGSDLRQRSR